MRLVVWHAYTTTTMSSSPTFSRPRNPLLLSPLSPSGSPTSLSDPFLSLPFIHGTTRTDFPFDSSSLRNHSGISPSPLSGLSQDSPFNSRLTHQPNTPSFGGPGQAGLFKQPALPYFVRVSSFYPTCSHIDVMSVSALGDTRQPHRSRNQNRRPFYPTSLQEHSLPGPL